MVSASHPTTQPPNHLNPAVSFLWHCPGPCGRSPLATTVPCGARTFLWRTRKFVSDRPAGRAATVLYDALLDAGVRGGHDGRMSDNRSGAATVGNFDGVHRGHAALIAELRDQARQVHCLAVAITFDPHPIALLAPERLLPRLTTIADRAELLRAAGVSRRNPRRAAGGTGGRRRI